MVVARCFIVLSLMLLAACVQAAPPPADNRPPVTASDGADVIEAARLIDDVKCTDDADLARIKGVLDHAIAQASPKVNVCATARVTPGPGRLAGGRLLPATRSPVRKRRPHPAGPAPGPSGFEAGSLHPDGRESPVYRQRACPGRQTDSQTSLRRLRTEPPCSSACPTQDAAGQRVSARDTREKRSGSLRRRVAQHTATRHAGAYPYCSTWRGSPYCSGTRIASFDGWNSPFTRTQPSSCSGVPARI